MGWLLSKRRLSLSGETVTMQLYLKDNLTIWEVFLCFCFWTAFTIKVEIYRQYIGPGCTRSALARQLIWKGILIYRRYIGAGCTRTAVDRLKIFTTSACAWGKCMLDEAKNVINRRTDKAILGVGWSEGEYIMERKEKLCRWRRGLSCWSCGDILCATNSGK